MSLIKNSFVVKREMIDHCRGCNTLDKETPFDEWLETEGYTIRTTGTVGVPLYFCLCNDCYVKLYNAMKKALISGGKG